jgi:uncharacterized protein (TIGR03086 family)
MVDASVEQLVQVTAEAERLVAGIRSDQWTAPTPCGEWTVRELINHVTGGDRLFTAALTSEERKPADDDPTTEFHDASADLVAAFRLPGVLAKVVTIPFGDVPGMVALHLRITEIMVHSWDLAHATNQSVTFPDDVVEQELGFTEGALAAIPPTRSPFAPPRPAAENAPALDRLAALLGRSLD